MLSTANMEIQILYEIWEEEKGGEGLGKIVASRDEIWRVLQLRLIKGISETLI